MTGCPSQRHLRSAMILVTSLMLAGLAFATPGLAQTRSASASMTIERALTVNTVRPMVFGDPTGAFEVDGSDIVTEAVIEVTGDPGRVYRVTLPVSIDVGSSGSKIDTFTLWSENSGDITTSLTARMNALGSDRLYIGGHLRGFQGLSVSGVTSAVPMGIDYE